MAKTLLIIENDETLVEIAAFYFTEEGYTVFTAFDGDEGVKLALKERPSAIMCDIIMGTMHGFDVLKTLRAHPDLKHTVIIMTSAKAYKPDIDRARELGATDYVVKPYMVDELQTLIERHLMTLPIPESQ